MRRVGLCTTLIAVLHVTAMPPAQATDRWACSFPSFTSEPLLVSYVVDGDDLIEKWQSGFAARFKLMQHNEFGLVAASAVAEIESGNKFATVGFDVISIDTRTREAWHAIAASGIPPQGNELTKGTCIAE